MKQRSEAYKMVLRRLITSALLVSANLMPGMGRSTRGDDKAREVIGQARTAIGGEAQLAAITSLQVESKFSRVMGDQTVTGDVQVSVMLPDKYKQVETTSMLGGSVEMTRTTALDGAEAWTDTGTSGGATAIVRFGGPKVSEAEAKRALQKAQRAEFARSMIAWLLASPGSFPVEFSYAGEGATDKGSFDMVDATGPEDFSVRIFLDKQTHIPALLSYRGVQPRMMMKTMEGGGSPEDAEKKAKQETENRASELPKPDPVEIQILLSDYKPEGGILLPHKLVKAAGGNTFEEVEITKYKINPSLKPQSFKK
jgi:hypothetical protein